MKLEHITFINSISYLGLRLRKLSDAFGLSPNLIPYYFNTKENVNYDGPKPDNSYYGSDEMSEAERNSFLE